MKHLKGPGDFSPSDPPELFCVVIDCICLTPDGECELGHDVNDPWLCIEKYEVHPDDIGDRRYHEQF